VRRVAPDLRRKKGKKIFLMILYQRHYRFHDNEAIDVTGFSNHHSIMPRAVSSNF